MIVDTILCHVPEVNIICLFKRAHGIKAFVVSVRVVVEPAVATPNISIIIYLVVLSGVNPGVVRVSVSLVFHVITIFPEPSHVPARIRTL